MYVVELSASKRMKSERSNKRKERGRERSKRWAGRRVEGWSAEESTLPELALLQLHHERIRERLLADEAKRESAERNRL